HPVHVTHASVALRYAPSVPSANFSHLFPPMFSHPMPVPPELHTLSLHDALPICIRDTPIYAPSAPRTRSGAKGSSRSRTPVSARSEEHTSELQSPDHLVCRLLLEKKKYQDECTAKHLHMCYACE